MNRSQRRKLAKQKNKGIPNLKRMVKDEVIRSSEDIYREAWSDGIGDSLILMLTFPLEVLRTKYWTKEQFDENIENFMNDILQLYDDFQEGKVTLDELKEDLWEYGGIRLEKAE